VKARAFIEAEEPGRRNVSRTCELLEVSKAAYYQARKAIPGPRASSGSCRPVRA
jgi:putative transposase